MTKSKSTVLLESRREPTLESKAIVDKRILFNDNQKTISVSYPVTWFDPFILSKSNAYQITISCKLPHQYQEIINQESTRNLRVMISLQAGYIALLTTTHFYLYSKADNLYTTQPIVNLYNVENTKLLFDIFVQNNNNTNNKQTIKILTIDSQGKAFLILHGNDKYAQYNILLHHPFEYITTVKWINADQALVGSSTGHLYLLNISSTENSILAIYKQRISGPLDYMKSFYTISIDHASDNTIPKFEETGPIVNISSMNGICYVCSEQDVSLWAIKSETKAVLIARIHLQSYIVNCILQHVPSNITETMLQCKIVNMDIKIKEELVLLVSYTVPELSEYLQYAVIKFNIGNENNTIEIYPKYTATLPYSALPGSLSKIPQLNITKDIAFVSLDDTVIARSLSRKSVFEESLVLKEKDNAILALDIVDSFENLDKAIVVTAKSDILEFQVNKNEIQEPRTTGNIYAENIENTLERDTMIFKSRLEQAMFFGVYKESPLRFPLTVEHHEDVGSAVMDVTNDILTEKCQFLPKVLDSEISFIESRFYFQNHMYKILQDHMLDILLSSEQRSRLFELLELYYLSKQLWKIVQEKSNDLEWIKSVARISQAVVKTNLDGKMQLEHVLRNHIYKIKEFLAQIVADKAANCIDDIIPRIIQKCRSFEEKNVSRYYLHEPSENNFSVQACGHLISIVDQKVHHFSNNEFTTCSDIEKQKLTESATLLLDIYSKEFVGEQFKGIKTRVIEGLCVVGLHQTVVDLADKYGDVLHIVTSLPKLNLSPEAFDKKSKDYIDRFGYEYFDALLKNLDNDDDIWGFCFKYSKFTEKFFSNEDNLPKLAWIHHVKHQNYDKAYKMLLNCKDEFSESEFIR
ncbi:hypothetical protein INT46_003117 [Mucor plumbeus]|uniref:Uncharacterized protein n=1 Tax=Mucor plumbeus TaxID=97098 RepID=A0A8H7UZN8_9FUNG|nr:hypothetical protein INT46_003117 [Mucor plumbeus]